MTKTDLSTMRTEFDRSALDERDARPDPFEQFDAWFQEAEKATGLLANTMALATADETGRPSARIVLLKSVDDRAFVFYTNYGSRKGHELAERPEATLLFFWAALERQVRVDGRVRQVSAETSDAYFRTRPRGSQLSAWASSQSEPIASRAALEARLEEATRRFDGKEVSRPPYWGGYALAPSRFEFWQGRENRLHDRLVYTPDSGGAWQIARLCP